MVTVSLRRVVCAFFFLFFSQNAQAAQTPPAVVTPVFKPNPQLASLADNTVIDLGVLNLDTPEGEPEGYGNIVTDYSGMTYDPHNHRILMFGGGHATTFTDAIYSFDLNTLKWTSLYKPTPRKFYKAENMDKSFWKAGGEGLYPRPVGRHTYDLLIVPAHRKEFLLLRTGCGPSTVAPGIGYFGGAGGAYDFATGKWDFITDVPFGGYGGTAEYDPVSKKIIGIMSQTIYLFDTDARKSTLLIGDIQDKFKVTSYSGTTVYCPIDQHMYTIPASKEVWRLELNRQDFKQSKIVKLQPTGTPPGASECGFAFDTANKIMGGGILGGKFFAYDPVKNEWSSQQLQGPKIDAMTFHCLMYDSVNNVYIFIAGKHTYAYRFKAAPKK